MRQAQTGGVGLRSPGSCLGRQRPSTRQDRAPESAQESPIRTLDVTLIGRQGPPPRRAAHALGDEADTAISHGGVDAGGVHRTGDRAGYTGAILIYPASAWPAVIYAGGTLTTQLRDHEEHVVGDAGRHRVVRRAVIAILRTVTIGWGDIRPPIGPEIDADVNGPHGT